MRKSVLLILLFSILIVFLYVAKFGFNASFVPRAYTLDSISASKLVFTSAGADGSQIYTMNPNGSKKIQLTRDNLAHDTPKWSKDKSKIAFIGRVITSNGTNQEVYSIKSDGSGLQKLTTSTTIVPIQPQFTPDGNSIILGGVNKRATIYQCGDSDVFIFYLKTAMLKPLTSEPCDDGDPRISPDGTKIAFVSDRGVVGGHNQIYIMDVNGANKRRITNNSFYDYDPAWSPDGRYLTYGSYRGEGLPIDPDTGDIKMHDWYIFKIDLATGKETQLTFDKTAVDWAPVWSPDGLEIGFLSIRGRSTSSIWAIKPDGTGLRLVYDDPYQLETALDW